MVDTVVRIGGSTVKVTVRGAQGPRGLASGPLGAGSVEADTITDDEADLLAITEKLLFQQQGTGSVVRTFDAKFGDTVSAADFGLIDGSSSNQTTQLQAAIDALNSAGGGILYVPPGTYRLRELRFKTNVSLSALGPVIFKLHTPGTTGYIARALGQTNVSVDGITFDCTTESGTTNTVGCVEVDDNGSGTVSENIDFTGCTFKNAQNNAWLIYRGGSKHCKVQDCQFLDHLYETTGGTHGLSIAEDSDDIQVTGCLFDHPSGTVTGDPSRGHIGIDRATNVVIDACLIQNAVLNGITIEDNALTLTQIIRISNTTIAECGNSGLQIEGNGLVELTVSDCAFRDNVAYGLKLAAGTFFRGMVTGCLFSGNADVPDLAQGYSQLYLNLAAGNVAHVLNCTFETASSASNFLHCYYLNGELTMDDCSFKGGSSGYGVYSPQDDAKAQERDTAILTMLRFQSVGTSTFNVPQFFGETWGIAGAEHRVLESIVTKTINTNETVDIFDIWTSKHTSAGSGTQFVTCDVMVAQTSDSADPALGAGGTYAFVATRTAAGTATLSAVTEDVEIITAQTAGTRTFSALTLTVSDVADGATAYRTRVSYRADTSGSSQPATVLVVFKIKVLWGGFRSAPVII